MKQQTSKRSSKSRIPKAKLAPKVIALRERGMTVKEIASAINRSERAVYDLLRWAKEDGSAHVIEIPDPISREDLDKAVQVLLEPTVEAFEGFFNRYSGRTLAPHNRKWVEDALSSNRVLINCPPRHAKSTIFSAWFPIWLVCMNRDVQILIVSQSVSLAKKFTNEIVAAFEENELLIKEHGRFKPELGSWPWRPNEGELMVEGRSRTKKSGDLTIQVRGAGQRILGMEANWIIADDVTSRPITRSQTEREKLSEWFHGDVMTRLEPQGRCVVIGQRLALHDIYGELAKENVPVIVDQNGDPVRRWTHINYPAVLSWPTEDAKGIWRAPEVLWPDKWPFEELMERRIDMGSGLFEAMYQQNPLPEGERLARTEWIHGDAGHRGCVDLNRAAGQGRLASEDDSPSVPTVRVLSVDPSPTRYAGLVLGDIPYNREKFELSVIELKREKFSARQLLHEIEDYVRKYAPIHYLIFEQNAAQRWLLQDPIMEKLKHRIRVIPHTTGRNKQDPEYGVPSMATDFEFGRIRLPYADPESKAMSRMLVEEAEEYPQGETDDLLMATWFIKINYASLVPRAPVEAGGWNIGNIPARLAGGWEWWPNKEKRAKQAA